MRKGEELEVIIGSTRFPNIGIVNLDNKEIRIKGGIRGTKALIRITRKKKTYYEGKIVEVLEKSPLESKEPCEHFGRCGGCSYQEFSYEDELKYKEDQVKNLFNEAGIEIDLGQIIASPDSVAYRNKMDFTFGDEYKDGPLALGMHRKGRFYEIENVQNCNIAGRDFTEILDRSLGYFKSTDLTFYNKRTHKGNLRNLVIRKSLTKGDILVNLVTSSQKSLDRESFVNMLKGLDLEGEITGILHTTNDSVADIIKPERVDLLWGKDFITEEICGLKFKISPFSFFQTNTRAAEKLYKLTEEIIGDIKYKTVFDLFSGTGTIAQIMAGNAKKVIAVEIVEEAVEMARQNARLNNINNIEFIAGDVFKVMEDIDTQPDLIVIDPPRPGLENSIKKILSFQPKEYVYVSCNPTTLVKDLNFFLEDGYRIEEARMVDQFPRTPHMECIVRLKK